MTSTNADWLFWDEVGSMYPQLHASTHVETFIFVASHLVPRAPHFHVLRMRGKRYQTRRNMTKKRSGTREWTRCTANFCRSIWREGVWCNRHCRTLVWPLGPIRTLIPFTPVSPGFPKWVHLLFFYPVRFRYDAPDPLGRDKRDNEV